MASLSDLYAPPSGNAAQLAADNSLQAGQATTDTGLANSLLLKQYQERLLPQLASDQGARGTFYGGIAGKAADQLKEDVGQTAADRQRLLDRQLANLRRSTVTGTTGMMVGY